MTYIHTLICTVGTSLFGGSLLTLSNSEDSTERQSRQEKIISAYDSMNWKTLAQELLEIDPGSRICGAEINAVEALRQKGIARPENLVLLVPNTPAGLDTGRFLKIYFEKRQDMNLKNVEVLLVENLPNNDSARLGTGEAKDIIQTMKDCMRRFGSPEEVAIVVTCKNDALKSMAVRAKQVLNVPVFYKHENSPELTELPTLLISNYDNVSTDKTSILDFPGPKEGHFRVKSVM